MRRNELEMVYGWVQRAPELIIRDTFEFSVIFSHIEMSR